jgi:hypothetical protein
MNVVEHGVANFREFKEDAHNFFEEQRQYRVLRENTERLETEAKDKAEKKYKEKKWTRMQKLTALGVVAVVVVPLTGWGYSVVSPIVSDIVQITQWYDQHKEEFRHKSMLIDNDSGVQSNQDAGGKMLPNH